MPTQSAYSDLSTLLDHEHVQAPDSHSFRLLRWDDSLDQVRECLGRGKTRPIAGRGDRWHAHQAIEITYIESGSGTRFIGDSIGSIEAPELVLLGSNLPHYWRGLNHQSRGAAIQFDLEETTGLASGLVRLPELTSLKTLWSESQRGLSFSAETARSIGARMRRMSQIDPLAALGELLSIVSQLSQIEPSDVRPLSDKQFALNTNVRYADHISRAINLIVNHYAEALTLDDLSQAVALSRVTLCRYFRRYTGRSVIAFLNGVRIDHARRQLIATSAPVSQIALSVGYGNLSHFNRQFARSTGETPSEFRKRHSG